jgi:hypothetical protein
MLDFANKNVNMLGKTNYKKLNFFSNFLYGRSVATFGCSVGCSAVSLYSKVLGAQIVRLRASASATELAFAAAP